MDFHLALNHDLFSQFSCVKRQGYSSCNHVLAAFLISRDAADIGPIALHLITVKRRLQPDKFGKQFAAKITWPFLGDEVENLRLEQINASIDQIALCLP